MTKLHHAVLCSVVCSWLLGLEPTLQPAHIAAQEVGTQKVAAERVDAAAMMSPKFVPDEAVAMVSFSPAELLANDFFKMFPVEVLRVQMKEQFGIDPKEVSQVQLMMGLGADGQPKFGYIANLTQDAELPRILEAAANDMDPIQLGDRTVYSIEGDAQVVLHLMNPRTIFVGMQEYLEPILQADDGKGPLATVLKKTPARSGINAVIAMEPVRPLVSAVAMQQAGALAPDLQPLAQVPALTEAITLNLDFEGEAVRVDLTVIGIDERTAQRIESILKESMAAAQNLAVAEMKRSMENQEQSEEMRDAMLQYANRISAQVIETLTPKRTGQSVTMAIESEIGVAGSSMLAGVLLPAIQSARLIPRRMSTSNNFKQVMLAMHNFHSAYNKLPAPAITDEDGKPLLSWRVAILPFVEEQALYQQFHLDEPWDSEHNLPLSKKLPAVYASPGVRLPAGETVIHAVVGKDMGLRPVDRTAFRDFLDGLSNTILIIETAPEFAVPWSKPADVEIDLADPLAKFKGTPKKGFNISLGDGAVRFLADTIDPDLFKAMLTRAGREVIPR